MQTFVPYPDIHMSASCLDYKRLGKQRVECKQILNVLDPSYGKTGWRNHPAVKMWKGHENELKYYANVCILEWISRGYKNTMNLYPVHHPLRMPRWWGGEIHSSHRANLLRKDYSYYSKFNWSESSDMPYFWPKI